MQEDTREGGARLVVAGLTNDQLDRVEVTIAGTSAAGKAIHIDTVLTRDDKQWTARFSALPVATADGYTFSARAIAGGKVMYAVEKPGVQIVARGEITVILVMQQTTEIPQQVYKNVAPKIRALVAATTQVGFDVGVDLEADAVDPDGAPAPMTYSWFDRSVAPGSFSPLGTARVTWTCPAASCIAGDHAITLAVSDGDLTSAITFPITADAKFGRGDALVRAEINNWPNVQKILIVDGDAQLQPSEFIRVQVFATDVDADDQPGKLGDVLHYAWAPSCTDLAGTPVNDSGSFLLGDTPTPFYFAPSTAAPGGLECKLTVTVTDERPRLGPDFVPGRNESFIVVHVLPDPIGIAPQIDHDFQSKATAAPGDVITLQIFFTDPQGSSVTSQWATVGGCDFVPGSQHDLVDADLKVIGNEIQCKAACGDQAHMVVALRNDAPAAPDSALRASISHRYDVALQACPPPPGDHIAPLQSVLDTDYVAVGVGGMRNQGVGKLTVAGVTGTVKKALLLWHGPTNSDDPAVNANVQFAGSPVKGTFMGISDNNCWGFANSRAYEADVTPLVTGNGEYALTGFGAASNSTINGANTNGASLLVFFDDGDGANNRDVYVFAGNDSDRPNQFDASGWSVDLPGVAYASGPASLQLHVADGQAFPDGAVIVNGLTIAPFGAIFDGDSVPGANNGPTENGRLWDIHDFNVTSIMNPGSNTLHIDHQIGLDCLSLVGAVVQVNHVNP